MVRHSAGFSVFFFNDTATTEIYTLSLHDALPIYRRTAWALARGVGTGARRGSRAALRHRDRSEEHTSELQSLAYLVCRLLLEKKNHGSEQHVSTPDGNAVSEAYNFAAHRT